jgi:hypothetical protein
MTVNTDGDNQETEKKDEIVEGNPVPDGKEPVIEQGDAEISLTDQVHHKDGDNHHVSDDGGKNNEEEVEKSVVETTKAKPETEEIDRDHESRDVGEKEKIAESDKSEEPQQELIEVESNVNNSNKNTEEKGEGEGEKGAIRVTNLSR